MSATKNRGARLVEALAARLRVPTDYRDLAVLAARWHGLAHRAEELRPRTILELLESCDAFRRPQRFGELLIACEADHRGRGGFGERPYPQAALLRHAQDQAMAVALTDADRDGLTGEKIGELLHRRRLAALRARA